MCDQLIVTPLLALTRAASAESSQILEVPTLTAWGKIFAMLLLAVLGVAYLVWRRPVMRAQAILETSPLGGNQPSSQLIDWRGFLGALVVVEGLALVAITVAAWTYRPISTTDRLGVLTSGAILALIVHLLILARNQRSHEDEL